VGPGGGGVGPDGLRRGGRHGRWWRRRAPEGDPFHVRLGGSEVIRGWNEGLVGMRRGAERRLVVPPGLAYGSRARGRIPAGSTLVFHVRVVDVG